MRLNLGFDQLYASHAQVAIFIYDMFSGFEIDWDTHVFLSLPPDAKSPRQMLQFITNVAKLKATGYIVILSNIIFTDTMFIHLCDLISIYGIWWQEIDYTSTRGGVSVLTNKGETTVSSLIIQKARIEDGGMYSCKSGQVDPASVKVHVLTGDTYKIKVCSKY